MTDVVYPTIYGRVVVVKYKFSGSTLATSLVGGEAAVVLDDVYDFSDSGGQARLMKDGVEEVVTYTKVNRTTKTLTLSGTVVNAHTAGFCFVSNSSDGTAGESRAVVAQEPGSAGNANARVPHRWQDVLAAGIRSDGTGEAVALEYDGREYVVSDILGKKLTVAVIAGDGSSPGSSPAPTVTPGFGDLFVSWVAVANVDPVTYDVHVSTVNGFTPSPATLAVSTAATLVVVLKDPATGLPVQYGTAYYVVIVARDGDGSAAASGQAGPVSPDQVDGGQDIVAGTITTNQIAANTITAGNLDVITLSAGTIQTATVGQRVVVDPTGIRLYASDNSTLVSLPTDGSAATFAGQINATALNIFGSATVFGSTGLLIEPNSHVQLVGGQGDPTSAPVASLSYPSVFSFNFNVDGNTVTGSRITHWSATGGSGGATACYYGTIDTVGSAGTQRTYAVEWLASNGHINRQLKLDSSGIAPTPVGFGACLIGSEVIAMRLTSNGVLAFDNIALSTFTLDQTTSCATQPGSTNLDHDNKHVTGFGCDGVNPYIFSYSNTTKLPNKIKIGMSAGKTTGATTITAFDSAAVKLFSAGDPNNLGDSGGPTNVLGAAWDGTNWYVSFSWATSASVLTGRVLQMYNGTTGTIVAKQEIYLPFSVGFFGGGITYDGTDYYLAGGTATTTNRQVKGTSALTWDYTAGTTWGIGYTWLDTVSGHFTAVSPVLSFSMDSGITAAPLQRATVVVTVSSLPSLANQNLLYAKPGSSTAAALLLQSATSHASSNTGQTITFKTYDAAGAVNGNSNVSTFTAGGTPAFIRGDGSGATASWYADSSGVFVMPRFTRAQRAAATKGDLLLDEDTGTVETYDGVGYSALAGPESGLTQLRRRIYEAAATAPVIKSVNFDQALALTTFTFSTSGTTRWYAVYWPGGTCTGHYYFIDTAAGAYTDANARSGTALYSSNGTTLTRQATVVSTLSEGTGIRKRTWTASASLAAGVYYVAIRFVFSTGAPTILFRVINNGDSSSLGGDVNNASTPSGWNLGFTSTDATQALPATQAVSGLGAAGAISWVGLF